MQNMDTLLKKKQPTIIAADVDMMGNLVSDGVLDIDGKIEGNVKARSITIRKSGRIRGDAVAEYIQVYGEVEGLIKARDVNLFATCRVQGTIIHQSLTIEDGAFVDGQFKRVDKISFEEEGEDDQSSTEYLVFRNLKLIS